MISLSHTEQDYFLVTARSGKSSIKVALHDGSVRTLHSLYDPVAEAGVIVDAFRYEGSGIIVILGEGLGYHVAELARRYPETQIIVVEAVSGIHRLAQEHGPSVSGDIHYITARKPEEVIREISGQQIRRGFSAVSVLEHASSVSAFPDYYTPIRSALKTTVSVKLWDRLRYRKFCDETARVLLIDSGYFLVRETEKALASLGHHVARLGIERTPDVQSGDSGRGLIGRCIQAILDFRPDFLITMNHLGFDESGTLTEFLRSIEMPAASWYVDSPDLIVGAFQKNVSPFTSLFLWDRSFIKGMQSKGFESVHYLPLATDESVFRPMTVRKHRKKLERYRCEVGFVGNSMLEPVQGWMKKVASSLHSVIESAAVAMMERGCDHEHALTLLPPEQRAMVSSLDEREMMDLEGAVLWKATLRYRLSCIEKLQGFNSVIHGDDGWRSLLNGERPARIMPPIHYYRDVPFFYNACSVNFNATSRQMKQAVNQRVFDVPACGAFLLTDSQEALGELFDVGSEMSVFTGIDEIPDFIRYYLTHPEERRRIAERGRERVLAQHTYRHRLAELITKMRGRYRQECLPPSTH